MIYKAILFFLLVSLLFDSTKTVGNYSLRSQMYYNLNVPSARTNLGNKAFIHWPYGLELFSNEIKVKLVSAY